MPASALLASIFLLFVVRLTDGIENGLHWASKPRSRNGLAFHQADLFQTWAARLLYAILVVALMGLGVGPAFVVVGLCTAEQSAWQMALNWQAAGHPLQGELDEAQFLWWPDSPKIFRNEWRVWQLAIGLWFVALGVAW